MLIKLTFITIHCSALALLVVGFRDSKNKQTNTEKNKTHKLGRLARKVLCACLVTR
jgi:hypothetical protein